MKLKKTLFLFLSLLAACFPPVLCAQERDSILFRGQFVFQEQDAYEELPEYLVYINACSQMALATSGEAFSVACARGDTILLTLPLFPAGGHTIELVAKDTSIVEILIPSYPDGSTGWYHFASEYHFEPLSYPKDRESEGLVGTYKDLYEDRAWGNYGKVTLKLERNGLFREFSEGFSYDYWYNEYHAGRWDVLQDTLICTPLPEMYPPQKQELRSGQYVTFPHCKYKERPSGWDPVVYKFLIRKKGLRSLRDKLFLRRIKGSDKQKAHKGENEVSSIPPSSPLA